MRITQKMIKESVDEMESSFTSNELIRLIFKNYICYDFDLYLKKINKYYFRDLNEKIMELVLKTAKIFRRSIFEMISYGDVIIINYTLTKVATKQNSEHD